MKQDHLDQQANILAAARRVLDSFSLCFHIYSYIYNTIKARLTDQRIKPAADYIMEHRNLLPKPSIWNNSICLWFEYIFQRQYTIIWLEALKMIIENEYNAYFIHQNYMVAKISLPGEKLKSALHLYNYLISE